MLVSSSGTPPATPIDLSAPSAPIKPALVHTTPSSLRASATGSGCAPASAVGPVYGGGWFLAEDHGPQVGRSAVFSAQVGGMICVTTLTILPLVI